MAKLPLEVISGYEGIQELIEHILETVSSPNHIVFAEIISDLPDCEQKTVYIQMALDKSITEIDSHFDKNAFSLNYTRLITDENERSQALRSIIDKYLLSSNFLGAYYVLKLYPASDYRSFELESITRHFLRAGNLQLAQEAASKNGRELTNDEIEYFLHKNIPVSFDNVVEAAALLKRDLTDNELCKVAAFAFDRKDYESMRRASAMVKNTRDRDIYLNHALESFLKSGDAIGTNKALHDLGREITADEAKKIISVVAGDDLNFLGACTRSLIDSEPSLNYEVGSILREEIKNRLKNKEFKAAMTIFIMLPERFTKLLEYSKEGLDLATAEVLSAYKDVKTAIEKYQLETKLAQQAANLIKTHSDHLNSNTAIEATLIVALALPAGEEKGAYLMTLYKASKETKSPNLKLMRKIAKMIDENNTK